MVWLLSSTFQSCLPELVSLTLVFAALTHLCYVAMLPHPVAALGLLSRERLTEHIPWRCEWPSSSKD